MSLSVTALLAAAVEVAPQAIVDIDGVPGLTVGELEVRSRVAAGALLAAGLPFGAPIRPPSAPGLNRAVQLIAAWRAGFVVNLDEVGYVPAPRPVDPTPEAENRLRVAESHVWSETPAVITSTAQTLTHGDLFDELLGGVRDSAHPAEFLSRLISLQPVSGS